MLATLVDAPFDDNGFRLITEKRGHAVRLWSRNDIDVTTRYAVLLPALQKIDGSCVIDGELCALDAHGRSRFQLLQEGNVRFWHKADIPQLSSDVRFWG
jgi:bifunctional non-homologous end joining protein LigD